MKLPGKTDSKAMDNGKGSLVMVFYLLFNFLVNIFKEGQEKLIANELHILATLMVQTLPEGQKYHIRTHYLNRDMFGFFFSAYFVFQE